MDHSSPKAGRIRQSGGEAVTCGHGAEEKPVSFITQVWQAAERVVLKRGEDKVRKSLSPIMIRVQSGQQGTDFDQGQIWKNSAGQINEFRNGGGRIGAIE